MITDKVAVQNYLLTDVNPLFDYQLNEWIAGVEEEMNRMTDRQLVADDEEDDYYYDGNGKTSLMIDDFVDISDVTVDNVSVIDDIFQYPANKKPKWRLEYESKFATGKQNVVVTGKRGYAASSNIPVDLKFAATVLVAGIINFSNKSDGEIKSESIGRYSVTYATDKDKADYDRALAIIKEYRRIR